MKAWPILGILFVEGILALAHWFLYCTAVAFWGIDPTADLVLRAVLTLLAVSFIVAALLSFRSTGTLVRLIYRFAVVWLGMLNYLFFAACLAWIVQLALRFSPWAAQLPFWRPRMAAVLFVLALAVSIYGVLNARTIHVRRIAVKLARLPESWRGRTVLLLLLF